MSGKKTVSFTGSNSVHTIHSSKPASNAPANSAAAKLNAAKPVAAKPVAAKLNAAKPVAEKPKEKPTLKSRAAEAFKYTQETASSAKAYLTRDPLTAFYEIGPWVLLIAIFLVFIIAGIAGLMGCSYDWSKLTPTFGLRDRIYVLG
jgi:hypothetical protein